MEFHGQTLCPDRIVTDAGAGFGMGVLGGGFFHFLKGMYNSPKGERFKGGAQAMRMNAPRIGGSFAVWGAMYSACDCTVAHLRHKEDPWNSIIAGAATGGLLNIRQGFLKASKSALIGGVFLAMIEGVGLCLNNNKLPQLVSEQEDAPVHIPSGFPEGYPTDVVEDGGSSSWFGRIFGKKKQEEKSSESKTAVLESFDNPSLPIPTFDYK
ncbi:mitochondrial import inner membrane translocase subunit TIM17-2-like [Papaver somniferum]|uniref:mitochondrial import inner membrane translocase subunit TIM17-2-like n=1 Tax=Papaver somniferum TaxID=3469 RepID=UPI000E6FE1EF|nr:mitochondrial import inner membrane translocase subunit TIM17-2-like [Papaver somniferum]